MHLLTDKEFLGLLSRLDIHISTNGGKLLISAPPGALDDAMRAELTRRKSQLLSHLDSGARSQPRNQTIPAGTATTAPLTFAQQQLWLIDRFHPGNIAYNIPEAFLIEQPLDLAIFRHAVGALVRRHRILAAYMEETDDGPMQRISSDLSIPIGFTDLSANDEAEQKRLLEKAIHAAAVLPFEIQAPPLIRFHIFRLQTNKHAVFFNVHHIIADGWSITILRRELSILYAAAATGVAATLPPLSIQYLDYAVWEKQQLTGETIQRQIDYWRRQLNGIPALLELPFSHSRPTLQSFAGAMQPISLSKQITDDLKRLAISEGASLFMTMLAAFSVLLYRYSGQSDFCIGSPVSSRNWIETEPLIGLFINTFILRCIVDGTHSFRDTLRATRETALNAYANKDVPFQKLVLELSPERDPGRSPFFQIMFALDTLNSENEIAAEQLNVYPGISKFDLTLQLAEHTDGINGGFEYRTDLFDAASIKQFSKHFSILLQSIISDPACPVGDLHILSDEERHTQLSTWNQTALDFPSDRTIHALFEGQATRTPDAIAILFQHERISYGQLNQRANQLAHMLLKIGAGPEALVGICMDRSIDMIVAILGILKAGAAYVPLDPTYPQQRLNFILRDSQLNICVSKSALLSRLNVSMLTSVCCFDRDAEQLASMPTNNPSTSAGPENVAYVIYTSGSTGQPKGVVVEHHNTVSFLYWAHAVFPAESLTGVLASTSICFDLSVFEIFLPLTFGHTVILAEDVLQITHLSAAPQVTILNAVPSAISALIKAGGLPQSLRVVNSAGEFLPSSLVQAIYASGNVTHVYDLYGPTETTTYSTFALRRPEAPPTIGRPIANTRIYLLDGCLQPVPTSVPGEIYIAGGGVTRGYLGKPELTNERFLSLAHLGEPKRAYKTGDLAKYRSDGNIEYIGRADHQIKLRGYRIELGEIETAMRAFPEVHDAIVLVARDVSLGDTLIGYVSTDDPSNFNKQHLLNFLSARLPAYMLVSQVVALASFPLTANGKVDRKTLPPITIEYSASSISRSPVDLVERQLANIWEHCFERKPIGIDENFFAIGGHSLLAFRIFSLIEKLMGKTLMLSVLFHAPTIATLAEVIRDDGWQFPELPIRAIRISGHRPAIYAIQHSVSSILEYENLARHLSSDQPLYLIDTRPTYKLMQSASDYANQLRRFQPDGPYILCASDSAAPFAYEIARLLLEHNLHAILVLFDPHQLTSQPIADREETTALSGWRPLVRKIYRTSFASRVSTATASSNRITRHFSGKVLLLQSQQAADVSAEENEVWWRTNAGDAMSMQRIDCPYGKLLVEPHVMLAATQLDFFLNADTC